ncbi:amidohydrolase [Tepidanaerobacter syntrophicus]|uniref:amidohydrolase n=1 Tax=Tepidanaerobacter syntrophicus TaxID=224999 RepID=UPI00176FB116|nr:amidohydrolase [Tepidanaerobacter syntrophicus]GLI18737.1 amidohydrolase [Tepidanaerobacter syntrophicus]GLI50812.1 amidohydrolase [Tepidanaerobacter syntrophicus]HHV83668.1 amidohydrolase [Tepidanaerobacter syntrophicus]
MIAIINGKIYNNIEGKFIENGTIIVDNGKIAEVGENLKAPQNAQVIDAAGEYVFPGFIDAHSHIGLYEEVVGEPGEDGNECTDPITPQLRAIDAINPADRAFDDAVKGGITAAFTGPGSANVIGGQSVVIKTYGKIVDNMIVRNPAGLKIAFGENPKRVYGEQKKMPSTRMASAALLREALISAQNYKTKREKSDPEKFVERDLKMEALCDVLDKKIPLRAHAHRADDIMTAIRIAKEFDVDIVIEHCTEGHLIADEFASFGIPAIVGPSLSSRSKIELENLTFETPGILSKKGIKVAIMTDHPVIPIQYLRICAAMAVREGMEEKDALAAITINPAEILGVSDRLGSIQKGKDADIVIWNGHPLEVKSKPSCVLVSGEIAYKES